MLFCVRFLKPTSSWSKPCGQEDGHRTASSAPMLICQTTIILLIVGTSAGSSELFPVSLFLIIRARKIPKTIALTIIDKIINVLNKL